jgi:chromosome segregation ATPase
MPTGVQTRARGASGDDGAVFDLFDPALWELDPTGNVLKKVAAAGEEASTGTATSRADLVALLQAAAAAAAELRETEAALESQVHSDEIATHGLNATLSDKDKEIARLYALRGADEEEDGGEGGALEEAAAELNELKRKLREKEASEARLMAASRDRSREDSHAQSQIDQLIGMVSTLAARQ